MATRILLIAMTAIALYCSPSTTNAQTVEDIPKLIEELKAGSSARAIPAAERLARLGIEAQPATAALTDALASRDAQVRIAAAGALKAIGPGAEPAIPALIAMLGDREVDQRDDQTQVWVHAADALAAIGPAAVKPMLDVLDPKQATVYQAICTALNKMGPAASEAIPTLIALIEKNDENVIPPIFALQGMGPVAKAAIPALIVMLDHANFHAQYFACRALGAMGAEAQPAVEKLIDRLKNGVTSVRRNAAIALGLIGSAGGDPALAALIDALDDPIQPVQLEALVALGRFGPAASQVIPKIKEKLMNPRFVGRAQAAGALWRIDPAEQDFAIELLMKELQGDNAPWDAAKELGQVAPQANRVDEIVALLDDPREETREYAAEALGWAGAAGKPAINKLETLANDENQPEDLRIAAREAIMRIVAAGM